jgi:molybdate transport system substrate-binding protein
LETASVFSGSGYLNQISPVNSLLGKRFIPSRLFGSLLTRALLSREIVLVFASQIERSGKGKGDLSYRKLLQMSGKKSFKFPDSTRMNGAEMSLLHKRELRKIERRGRGITLRTVEIFVIFFLFLSSSASVAGKGRTLTMPATKQAAVLFEKETGIHVELHFGGSGSMLSQMSLSRRGDVYFPGSSDYMAKAIETKAVQPDSVREIAYLIPAINVPRSNPKSIEGLQDLGRKGVKLAIANPRSVCVGLYAVEILEKNGLKERVKPNIKTYVESCSRAASIVALKNVDAAIGWRVFGSWNPRRILTIALKPHEIPRIASIPIAISTFSQNNLGAQQFIDFLKSDAGKNIFRKWGYIVTEAEARRFAPNSEIGGRYEVPPDW